jgi:mannose/cellobiose epimerase-like protein (N-acyl-D-glucosamine 2-epimerase family)
MATDYLSRDFLKAHLQRIIDFYHPACLDQEYGGYICSWRDDGTVLDRGTKHIVATTRFIYDYCLASVALGRPEYRVCALHGLDYLETYNRRPEGGYAWLMDGQQVRDGAKFCYGHAFVLLAYAAAHQIGLDGMRQKIDETYDLLEQRFWRPADGLYVDKFSEDWSQLSPYRGQNANMHMCEATLLAYEATGETHYLERAYQIAHRLNRDLAPAAGGLIYEHYTSDWSQDWAYNRDNPADFWRPYGFAVGHQAEWSKLLLILERHRPEAWILPQAEHLFHSAVMNGWDAENGGLSFTFDPTGQPVIRERRHWVLNETIAAAALLTLRTGRAEYREWYDRLWAWAEVHMVDHQRGGWFSNLHPNNARFDYRTEPVPRDFYHPQAMCFEILRALRG